MIRASAFRMLRLRGLRLSKIRRNCRMVDSKSNVLVQLADMIAGSFNRAENQGKKDSKMYKKIIKKHIEDEWRFK